MFSLNEQNELWKKIISMATKSYSKPSDTRFWRKKKHANHHIIPVFYLAFLFHYATILNHTMREKYPSNTEYNRFSVLFFELSVMPNSNQTEKYLAYARRFIWGPWNIFHGPIPQARLDDPGPNVEQNKPANFDPHLWSLIQNLYKAIESLYFFPFVKAKEDSVYDNLKLLVNYWSIQPVKLPYAYNPADWDFYVDNKQDKKNWFIKPNSVPFNSSVTPPVTTESDENGDYNYASTTTSSISPSSSYGSSWEAIPPVASSSDSTASNSPGNERLRILISPTGASYRATSSPQPPLSPPSHWEILADNNLSPSMEPSAIVPRANSDVSSRLNLAPRPHTSLSVRKIIHGA